jgi:hypothetical protein
MRIFIRFSYQCCGSELVSMRTHADLDFGQALKSQKVEFYTKNILKLGR